VKSERWQQVEQLYHAALECDAKERSAFLAEACAGDDSLRREVESLLAYEDQAENFIESPALEVVAKVMAEEKVTTMLAGQTINHYKITAPLGAGGMGEVYLAEDTRLERKVALKFLPAHLTQDKRHLHRFQQEARAVAALSHPNVCAIHEVMETGEGRHCIVMEYVDGVSLRERMAEGRMKLAAVIDVAAQIGSALAAAHTAGIVHRDIKPENIMLRRDGYVKVLDFGLAKLTEKKPEPADSESETRALELKTLPGLVMGTVAYMSPEQARGLPVDARTDIWSLGVVLYEMLSGVSPFKRDTAAETMTTILREEPPELPDSLASPPALLRILRHCLEKDPEERFQNARDLVFDLEAMSGTAPLPAVAEQRRFSNRYVVALLTAAALALVGGAAFVVGRRTAATPEHQRVTGVHRLTDFTGLEEFPAIAPDLKSIAFTARVDGSRQIFVRLLAGGTPLQITTDAVDHELPRWTRDASSVVYFSPAVRGDIQGTIWEISALGGAPRRVIDSVGGADVRRDGRIACFRLASGKIEVVSVSPDGADLRVIVQFDEPVYYKYPRWSPDGKWIAYQRGDGVRWDIFAVPACGGPPRQLTRDNRQIHGLTWLPDSSGIVYSSSLGTTMPYLPTLGLWEVGLDGANPRLVAPPDLSYLQPDIHQSGAMAASRLQMQFDLWRFPTDGSPEENVRRAVRLTRQTAQVQTPTVGSTDREIAFLSDSGGHSNLWMLTPETGALRQITQERDPNVALGVPIWAPDGKWIAFVSSRGNTGLAFGVWIVSPDGGNLRNLVPRGLGVTWSPDARWLYYADAGTAYKVSPVGGSPVRVRSGPARNMIGSDGTTLYFMVDRTLADGSPGFEIHAASPEDAPSRVLARIPASRAPQWQIINPALSPDGALLAMPLTDGPTTNIWTLSTATGEWRQITDFGERPIFIARRVSWSADGRSILAAVGEGDADIVLFEMK
jgi:Tol biopolymer transport system component/predicted Ser/Thr protein kinase